MPYPRRGADLGQEWEAISNFGYSCPGRARLRDGLPLSLQGDGFLSRGDTTLYSWHAIEFGALGVVRVLYLAK